MGVSVSTDSTDPNQRRYTRKQCSLNGANRRLSYRHGALGSSTGVEWRISIVTAVLMGFELHSNYLYAALRVRKFCLHPMGGGSYTKFRFLRCSIHQSASVVVGQLPILANLEARGVKQKPLEPVRPFLSDLACPW